MTMTFPIFLYLLFYLNLAVVVFGNSYNSQLNHHTMASAPSQRNITLDIWETEGERINITCVAKNFPPHTRLQWIHYNNSLTQFRYDEVDIMYNKTMTVPLFMNLSASSDGIIFFCQADSKEFGKETSKNVTFRYKKSVTIEPISIRDTTKDTAALRKLVVFNIQAELEDINPQKSNPKCNANSNIYNITKKIEGNSINIICSARFDTAIKAWKIYWVQYKNDCADRIPYEEKNGKKDQGDVTLNKILTETDNSSVFYCESEYRINDNFLTETSEKVLFVSNNPISTLRVDETSKTTYMILVGLPVIIVVVILIVLLYYQRRRLRKDSKDQSHKSCTETVQYATLSLRSSALPWSGASERSQYSQIIGVLKPQSPNIKM